MPSILKVRSHISPVHSILPVTWTNIFILSDYKLAHLRGLIGTGAIQIRYLMHSSVYV